MSRPFVSQATGRHRSELAAEQRACPLTQPGILLAMVSPEQPDSEPASGTGFDPGLRLLGATAVGLGVGAFVAAMVRGHAERLAVGDTLDPLAWRGPGWAWAVALVLGAAVGLFARRSAAQRALRLALVGLGLLAAVVHGVQQRPPGTLPWLHGAIAFALGAAAGRCAADWQRGSAWPLVALAAFVGGGGAVAGIEYGTADLCGASAFGACLVAGSCTASAQVARATARQAAVLLGAVAAAVALTVAAPLDPAWLAAFLALALVGAGCVRPGLPVGAAVALGVALWLGGGEPAPAASAWLLDRHGGASLVYQRRNQEMQLVRDGRRLVAFGPARTEGPLAAAMVTAFSRAGDRVLLVGAGAERLARALPADPTWLTERLLDDRELGALPARLCGDGPVPPPDAAHASPPWRDVPGPLTALGGGSRQLVVVAEDALGAGAHRRSDGWQRELRRLVGDGVVLQLLALDEAEPAALVALLDAVARAHPWNGLYLVGDGGVLVSAPRQPARRGGFAGWSDDARWCLHEAHLGGPDDLDQAFTGVVTPPTAADAVGVDLARVLLQRLGPPAVGPTADSLLLRWLRGQSDQRRARARLLALRDDDEGRAEAQALTAPFLPTGAPQPWLQAAMALPDLRGGRLADPGRAVRAACSLDPTFFDAAPAVFASLPRPRAERFALEDLWQIGAGRRLAERCAGEGPLAVALRARFASRCARALVGLLADGPLTPEQGLALRELADPFVLGEAARVVVPAGRALELLGWWRFDLPLPAALRDVGVFAAEQRRRLAAALAGRREPSCHPLLADLLLDEDREVRAAAGEALQLLVDGAIPFDPDWPRSARLDAAARLRELHNRRP
ncbi:MAG: hypothetical protein H6835_06330 [Planctomycetes bacterium]|nr:hypothetical protein [Planctomycetota bacterium]